jgi:hypothetical protein
VPFARAPPARPTSRIRARRRSGRSRRPTDAAPRPPASPRRPSHGRSPPRAVPGRSARAQTTSPVPTSWRRTIAPAAVSAKRPSGVTATSRRSAIGPSTQTISRAEFPGDHRSVARFGAARRARPRSAPRPGSAPDHHERGDRMPSCPAAPPSLTRRSALDLLTGPGQESRPVPARWSPSPGRARHAGRREGDKPGNIAPALLHDPPWAERSNISPWTGRVGLSHTPGLHETGSLTSCGGAIFDCPCPERPIPSPRLPSGATTDPLRRSCT